MSNMNGGVMKSQRARVGAGYQPPALPFAQLPNPDSVLGRVYTASDVGPAPGIELIAAPGRWRPRGGRQVLAMRSKNPVTVQSLADAVAETIGPFPGGLVRAGMRLEMDTEVSHSGIGTSIRAVQGQINGGVWWHSQANNSGAALGGRKGASLNVQSNGSEAHPRWTSRPDTYTFGVLTSTITVDFSQQWWVDILMQSAAETPVNISSATWAGGIATINTAAAHTLAVGDKTVTAGVTPTGWNIPDGAIVLSVPTSTQFTVALAANPGAYTSGGTSSRISNMISQSYVLELVG
jgi:hypothetical protein